MSIVMNWAGKLIDPLNLKESDMQNLGMQAAVTLSRLQRFWGQCRESYTVAQHCLSMVEMFDGDLEMQRWALGHEIYEALTGMDVPSPIKHSSAYEPYLKAENEALDLFARIYGLTPPMPNDIKVADRGIMVMEAEALMPYNSEVDWRGIAEPRGTLYRLGASDDEIKRDFLIKWQELFGKL